MSITNFAVLVAIFGANTVEQAFGFAGTALAMPVVTLLVGLEQARVLLNAPSVVGCGFLALSDFRYVNRPVFFKILGLMLVGMAIGVTLSSYLPASIALPLCGLLIMGLGLHGLFSKGQMKLSNWGEVVLLVVAGVFFGMFLIGGALTAYYAVKKIQDKHQLRATLATLWFCLSGTLFLVDIWKGAITTESMGLVALTLLPLLLAVFAGRKLHNALPQETFTKIAYVCLILSGSTLLL